MGCIDSPPYTSNFGTPHTATFFWSGPDGGGKMCNHVSFDLLRLRPPPVHRLHRLHLEAACAPLRGFPRHCLSRASSGCPAASCHLRVHASPCPRLCRSFHSDPREMPGVARDFGQAFARGLRWERAPRPAASRAPERKGLGFGSSFGSGSAGGAGPQARRPPRPERKGLGFWSSFCSGSAGGAGPQARRPPRPREKRLV